MAETEIVNGAAVDTQTGEIIVVQELPPLAGLVQKIIRAARLMKHLEKTGENRFQNYKYISVESLISEVRGPLLKEGLLLYRSACDIRTYELRQSDDNGKLKVGTYVTMDLTFRITDGWASIDLPATAEARDTGDKAIQKAETAALKYALFQNFLLQGNEDDLDNGANFAPTAESLQNSPANNAGDGTETPSAGENAPESTAGAKKGRSRKAADNPQTTDDEPQLASEAEIREIDEMWAACEYPDAATKAKSAAVMADVAKLPKPAPGAVAPDFSKLTKEGAAKIKPVLVRKLSIQHKGN